MRTWVLVDCWYRLLPFTYFRAPPLVSNKQSPTLSIRLLPPSSLRRIEVPKRHTNHLAHTPKKPEVVEHGDLRWQT